jgi:hypothetical protein
MMLHDDKWRARMRALGEQVVPMSSEDMKLRGVRNARHHGLLNLWFVDGTGMDYFFVESEIRAAGLDVDWPEYMKHDFGIKRINEMRREKAEAGS